MSLDDKFNPNDGSLVDSIDNSFYKFNKKIAEKWQDKTYKSAKILRRELYGIGALAFLTNAISAPIVGGAAAIWLGAKSAYPDIGSVKNGLESEIQCEAIGFPHKAFKCWSILFYSWGIFETALGLGQLVKGIAHKDNESLMASAEFLSRGIGILSWASGEYIARGDYGEPPKKPKKKSVLEKIKEKFERFLPHPSPEPALIGMYSTIKKYSLIPPINSL